ncbi:hypothetical protein TNCV_5025721 [Trichonephila clavipes]|nr:hypothetical protein TNCV_5025721 [Trichonephila clavipes]
MGKRYACRTVTCMVLKANDRRTSCSCHDEFLLFEGNTRNRWRDGPVCPAVDKELLRLGPDSSGQEKEKTGKKKHCERESERRNPERERPEKRPREREKESPREKECEARLEWRKRAESGNWSGKDDERRWR